MTPLKVQYARILDENIQMLIKKDQQNMKKWEFWRNDVSVLCYRSWHANQLAHVCLGLKPTATS